MNLDWIRTFSSVGEQSCYILALKGFTSGQTVVMDSCWLLGKLTYMCSHHLQVLGTETELDRTFVFSFLPGSKINVQCATKIQLRSETELFCSLFQWIQVAMCLFFASQVIWQHCWDTSGPNQFYVYINIYLLQSELRTSQSSSYYYLIKLFFNSVTRR